MENQNPESRKSIILCIDDDAAMHSLLESLLVVNGYRSLHAASGEEALGMLRAEPADLIILDINMPGMDGFQILRRLKAEKGTDEIPVIFLSSLSRENLKVKGLEHGADDFVVKPFTGPELIARIKAVLRRRGAGSRQDGDVQGNLEDLGLFELLHMFSFSGKSAVIRFPEMNGELVVANGAILDVRQASWRGREALLRLFMLGIGSFVINYGKRSGEELGNIESLLLFIGTTLDEINENIESIVPKGALLRAKSNLKEFPDIDQVSFILPAGAAVLCAAMQGELDDNLNSILNALLSGNLAVQEPSRGRG